MEEFDPEKIAKMAFEELNEYDPRVTNFLNQERFLNLTPLQTVEICEKEIPSPTKHLSLGTLSLSHPAKSGVIVHFDIPEMLINNGIKKQKAYQMTVESSQEIYRILIEQGFEQELIPKFHYLEVESAAQPDSSKEFLEIIHGYKPDPSKEFPPPNAWYTKNGEVYLLDINRYLITEALNVALSKKLNVKLADSII